MTDKEKDPIVNCHVHIFTGDHVPPLIGKSLIRWPFYYLAHVHLFLRMWKVTKKIRDNIRFNKRNLARRFLDWYQRMINWIFQHRISRWIYNLISAWLTLNALYVLLIWLSHYLKGPRQIVTYVNDQLTILFDYFILLDPNRYSTLGAVIFVLVFIALKSSRNIILYITSFFVKFFKAFTGSKTRDLLERYMLLGRYTLYKYQHRIYSGLQDQYPEGTKFIVLPMDMEFMAAGTPPVGYYDQMEDLAEIKAKHSSTFYPFVFVDPRRIDRDKEKFFSYQFEAGKIKLNYCHIKKFIEEKEFSGFKIYPALGYFPFDERLLPLWKYAADNSIPIMSHCILGTIFYRGIKEKSWNEHLVFRESIGDGKTRPLPMIQSKNLDYSLNFTHPLNYLCLLSEPLLRIVVSESSPEVQEIFGYTDLKNRMTNNLSHLKICMAHFGGEDQWDKYLEKDRYSYAQQLIQNRGRGLDFSLDNGQIPWGRFEQHWKYVDWYSIICSLMAQFDNVYTDVSYIISKPEIVPLLKETISDLNPKIRNKVLFGTDFYVVRNHHSDKELMANSAGMLSTHEFDLIARTNPKEYLRRKHP